MPSSPALPRLPSALLRRLLPPAERGEVLEALAEEYGARAEESGSFAAHAWVWRQVLASAPALARRGWWRGWSGFEARADQWQPGDTMFESWARDLKFVLRRLRTRPTYAALTVLTLALGVAGSAAVFGIAKRLLLEPLPFRAEEEVVIFWSRGDWRASEFAYLRPSMDRFQGVAAIRPGDATLVRGDAPARLLHGVATTAELFDVLGVRPALGPGFQPGDDVPGAEPKAVLSHALWRDLGGDPGIVGQRLELAGAPRTVVGVMPPGFWFPDPTVQVWLSAEANPDDNVGQYALIGRLPAGVGIQGMEGELARLTGLLGEAFQYPEQWDKTLNAELTPIREHLVGPVRPAILAVLGAVAAILLIACVYVSAMVLGQVDSRGTELWVRTALGAGRRALLQQLLVESLVIGAVAGLVGAGLAVVGFRFLAGALPLGPLAETATVDWTLFAAAMLIGLAAATAVALAPGLSMAGRDPQQRLAGARTGGVVGRGARLESALVVAQVALVLLMAAGAALLIRSVANLRAIDPGLDPAGVAVIDVVVPGSVPASQRPQLTREILAAVEGLPGVVSAGSAQPLPLRGGGNNWGISVESQPELESTSTFFRVVTPDYFRTMGIRVRHGRGLVDSDRLSTDEGVVVINQALADRYFPGMDPLGQRIGFMNRWDRIVGVVDDVAEGGLTDEPHPARYMLYDHVPWLLPAEAIVLRTESGRDPAALLEPARRAIQSAHPTVAVQELTTMQNVFDRAVGPARQVMALLTLLSALALVLGAVGVYGVVSHFVIRRRRDWGIRMALGLRPGRVVQQVVGHGGRLVGAGVVLGLAAFLLLARLLASFLYGVGTADPLAIVGAAVLLVAAGLVAAYIPARRASRIDPALALRE